MFLLLFMLFAYMSEAISATEYSLLSSMKAAKMLVPIGRALSEQSCLQARAQVVGCRPQKEDVGSTVLRKGPTLARVGIPLAANIDWRLNRVPRLQRVFHHQKLIYALNVHFVLEHTTTYLPKNISESVKSLHVFSMYGANAALKDLRMDTETCHLIWCARNTPDAKINNIPAFFDHTDPTIYPVVNLKHFEEMISNLSKQSADVEVFDRKISHDVDLNECL